MSLRNSYANAWEALPITVGTGASLSETVNLGGFRLFAVGMPSLWTAANLTFQVSPDGGTTWLNLKDQDGNDVMAVATADACIALSPSSFAAAQYLRLRSGTLATPVGQEAARTLKLIVRPL